jgi:CheY-like chemotaxis protein
MSRTVLVIDDEFGIVEVLETILADAGYEVMTALHGRQGLKRMAERRPDLVLVDYMMPFLNGADLIRAMRKDPALADIPVILMTSLDPRAVTEIDGDLGLAGFLMKPFRAAAITEAVARAFRRQQR